VLARLPQAARIFALGDVEQYAVAELFRGTMLTHSAIVYRQGKSQEVNLSGPDWLDHVPIRLPDTLCVQEKLPPGAAGVLINRAHAHRDIYLPINAQEKRLFEAIDGERSIGDIAGLADRDGGRALFQRLWWHDQVVFDASRIPKRPLAQ
jgi:hypothetical protein